VVAELLFGSSGSLRDQVDPKLEILLFCVTIPVWVVLAKVYGLYSRDEQRTDYSTSDDLVPVFHLVTVGAWVIFVSARLTGLADPQLGKLAAFWALAVVLVTLGRSAARAFCRRSPSYVQDTVIVGAGDVGRLVARKLARHPEYGINPVGFVDRLPPAAPSQVDGLPLLGSLEDLPEIAGRFDIARVVVAFPASPHEETLDVVRSLNELGVQVDVVPRLFELISPGIGVHTAEGLPLVGLPPANLSRSSRLLKRGMDGALAALALALLAPVFVVVAILIKLETPGPVFFRQVRMGSGERSFRIYKFRTMVAGADEGKAAVAHLNVHALAGGDERMFKIPDDPRVTRVGRFLRTHSLDELPQLVNVLEGDMALVGPRPLILDEDRYVNRWQRRRLDLKPGMSGLWQVLGRSHIPFDEMVKLDYLYVTTWSIWTDIRLLLRTIPIMLRGQGGAY
jgi:exopolysaccharide biosynthesis polyprenyl glycosylphosphotransferase